MKMSSIFSPYHERYLDYMNNLVKSHPEIKGAFEDPGRCFPWLRPPSPMPLSSQSVATL